MFIIGIVLLCLGIVLLFIAIVLDAMQKRFLNTCRVSSGSIIEYKTEDDPSKNIPIVMFDVAGHTIKTMANPVGDTNKPEIGETIRIAYSGKGFLGKNAWEVQILNGEPIKKNKGRISFVLRIAGIIIVSSAILLLFGTGTFPVQDG